MKIPGIILRPCSTTEEENEAQMRASKFFTESGFYEKYRENIAANQIIAESAKIFILSNYKKINDWSDLDVEIISRGEKTHYYKFKDNGWNTELDAVNRMVKKWKENENPVESLTDIVLDPTDGDFSITIDGKEHWWIDDDSVITIADYIERNIEIKL